MRGLLGILLALVVPVVFAQGVTPPPIAAKAFIVIDMLSGQTLAAANEDDRFDPASLPCGGSGWPRNQSQGECDSRRGTSASTGTETIDGP